MHRSRLGLAVLALCSSSMVTAVFAGPLAPPAGGIQPTYKTLQQVEPRRVITFEDFPGDGQSVHLINQAGSYYLMSNVYVPSGKTGIKIAASNVTLDLNGFAIIDLGGAAGTAVNGIVAQSIDGPISGAVIRNGSVVGCNRGIVLTGSDSSRVESITCSGQTSEAFFLGASSQILNCNARAAGTSFFLGDASRAENCTASASAENGFTLGTGASAFRCTSNASSADGFNAGPSSRLDSCSSINGYNGIVIGARAIARDCDADGAQNYGFIAASYATIDRCSASDSPGGFSMGGHTRLTNSTAVTTDGAITYGIHVNGDDAIIKGNTVLKSAFGVFLTVTSDRCTVIGNYLSAITSPILDNGSQNHIGPVSFEPANAGPHANFID